MLGDHVVEACQGSDIEKQDEHDDRTGYHELGGLLLLVCALSLEVRHINTNINSNKK